MGLYIADRGAQLHPPQARSPANWELHQGRQGGVSAETNFSQRTLQRV